MTTVTRAVSALLVAGSIVACTPAQSPQDRIDAAELAALAPLRKTYAPALAGFDVKGDTLLASVDLQGLSDMDDDTEAAMKRDVVRQWRAAWVAAHPHAHATLRVRFIDFRAKPVFAEATKV